MKAVLLTGFLLASAVFLNNADAQIHLEINIGVQPSWGPTGYDHVEYYYIPDIRCYYYVPGHQFIFQRNGHWAFSYDLPPAYRGYDLFHSYKVVLNEPQAYLHYDEHRKQYDHFRGGPNGQQFIHDSHEDRYRDHWHDQHEADEGWRHHDGKKGRDRDHH
jgi:hypothetical protein